MTSPLACAQSQIRSADAAGKAEIILDLRTHTGLSSDRKALDHNGLQALGSAVDGAAKTGWPGSVDGQVVLRSRGVAEQSQFLADLPNGRTLEPRAVGKDAERQLLYVVVVPRSLYVRLV